MVIHRIKIEELRAFEKTGVSAVSAKYWYFVAFDFAI